MQSGDSPFGMERPQLISEFVLEQLRDAIIDKRLEPGARLNEATLATMLDVSRTPVRWALLQLRIIGLVTSHSDGLRVVEPSATLVQEAFEMRAGFEALAAQMASTRAEPGQLAAIRHEALTSDERARAEDMSGFRKSDREFHALVANASRNSMIAQHVINSRDLCQALRQRDVMTDEVSRACGEAHIAIATAIGDGDADLARREMADHVLYVGARVLDSLHTEATESV